MTETEEAAGNVSRKRNSKIKKTREAKRDNEEIPRYWLCSPPREWPVQISTGQEAIGKSVGKFKWMENLIGSNVLRELVDIEILRKEIK